MFGGSSNETSPTDGGGKGEDQDQLLNKNNNNNDNNHPSEPHVHFPEEASTASRSSSIGGSGSATGGVGRGGAEKRHSFGLSDHIASGRRASADDGNNSPGGTGVEKKRRSGRASSFFASARNSLHLPGSLSSSHSSSSATSPDGSSENAQTPFQKLGKQDPALAVPQGPQNNSAGESLPGARSTFRVGVTEDKNKKCRRTMEDTHAYLYNFLNTPAPVVGASSGGEESVSPTAITSEQQQQQNHDRLSPSDVAETDNGYFAIFDGHAGTFAADWCGKKLHGILEDAIRKNPNTPIPELLDLTFTTVDQELEKLPLKNSGCTAVIAVLRWEDRVPNSQSATGSAAVAPAVAAAVAKATSGGNGGGGVQPEQARGSVSASSSSASTAAPSSSNAVNPSSRQQAQQELQEAASRQRVLYTANVGDARIVLCRNGKALRLSYDHKGSDENEGRRVASAGGLILNNRVNGVLAVTRALGDTYMKDLVTGHPYTTETVIQPDADEFIILACDGLWDVCTDQEAVDLIRDMRDPQAASKALVDHALARFSTDNLSCMVIRLIGQAIQNRVEHRTEPMGVEGDPGLREAKLSEADAIVLQATKRASVSSSSSTTSERDANDAAYKARKHTAAQGGPGPGAEVKAAEG
ncbi:MAG: Protein phosphatase 2C 1 [Peltula sp. TS41687]|nr:MAG: Protein phosphatase 2C 1 [Peltula sp. TS41687]